MSRRLKFEQFCESFMVLYNGIMVRPGHRRGQDKKQGTKFEWKITFNSPFDKLQDSGDDRAIEILHQMSLRATIFSRSNLSLGSLATVLFLSYPRLIGSPNLPYGLYIHGVDFLTSPAYEIGYVFEILVTCFTVMLYIPFINIVMSFIIFGIGLIQNLNFKFQTIAEPAPEDKVWVDNDLIERRFKLYIEYHKRIIRYVDEINELVSTVCLVEIILFGVLLSALLFLTVIVQKRVQLMFACIYIFMIMFQLFTFYWLSNELIEQSGQLGHALYESPWYTFNIQNRKTLLLVMARTQNPLNIMIGNIAPITLQTFQSIINVSYSYFTILRRNLE